MTTPRARCLLALATALAVCCDVATVRAQTAKTFPPPAPTVWRPVGCRVSEPPDSLFPSRAQWHTLHADALNTDEVEIAYAPVFEADWVAEPDTWNPTGPTFDRAGNLYVAPLNPHSDLVLISLDPETGARRWAIPNSTGTPSGGGAPLVLSDPDTTGGEVVYQGRYDRVVAVRTDGSVAWDMPTGLSGPPVGAGFGMNYHPGADAVVGLTRDGFLYALDRATGAPLLAAPHQLPGEAAPPGPPLAAPPVVQACAEGLLGELVDLEGQPISLLVDVLLGNGVEVANYFSIDPTTGRMWVAATAPDAEDGVVDGVSSLGALYGLDLVPDGGGGWQVTEACHVSFDGGSASTPALRRDGGRIYIGDNVGNLFAIDPSCNVVWTLGVGGQITGSIAVASDNGELYASTLGTIVQVIDHGDVATIGWLANLDVFDLLPGQQVANQVLVGIGANAVSFQAGAVVPLGATRLTVTTGVGLLDRLTGAVRWFAPGLEETVAVMSTGPDGALYLGNSPLRRLFTYCLAQLGVITTPVEPPIGGIRKWRPTRPDLELREAVCAASDRARNAHRFRRRCPASTAADLGQLGVLLAQSRRAATAAVAGGALSAADNATLTRRFATAEQRLATGKVPRGAFKSACKRVRRALGS